VAGIALDRDGTVEIRDEPKRLRAPGLLASASFWVGTTFSIGRIGNRQEREQSGMLDGLLSPIWSNAQAPLTETGVNAPLGAVSGEGHPVWKPSAIL